MSATILSSCNTNLICTSKNYTVSHPSPFLGSRYWISESQKQGLCNKKRLSHRFSVYAATKGPAKSSDSEDTIPSWAKPASEEPPPWARDESTNAKSQQSFEIPFFVYLLASAVTAIAAIGSVFEYVNQRPVFGILNSDSIFYAPLLGFFAVTGIPTSAFLWIKSVQAANEEAKEQDKRDGYM